MDHTVSPTSRPFEVTSRSVLAIALPMTIAFLTTPLLGLTDIAVIGQLGDPVPLAGLAIGALAFDVIFSFFGFLRTGTTGFVAQAEGRGDLREQAATIWRAIALAIGGGVVLLAASPLIGWAMLAFMQPEPHVAEAFTAYFGVRILAAPISLLNYAVLGYVLGIGRGSLALTIQLVLNGGNIVFSVLFGLVFGWGLTGVALGTVLGEIAGLAAGAIWLAPRLLSPDARIDRRAFSWPAFRPMLAVNRDIMIRTLVLTAAFALLTRQGAAFGTLTLAANSVLMNFFLLSAFFLDGFAAAAEQLAGRAVGACHERAFRQAVRLTAFWGFGVSAVVFGILLLGGSTLIATITTAEDVRAVAMTYLPWAALTALTGVLAFQMDGVFIGATWSRDMRNMMLVSFALYAAALFALGDRFGNHGLWAALNVFLLARGLTLLAVMRVRARELFG